MTSGLLPPSSKIKEVSLSPFFSKLQQQSMGFQEIGKNCQGRGSKRGVIGDELTDGRKKTLLFFFK
jgi:hypothetical protein